MPADITKALRRKRMRQAVLYRKTAISLDEMFARIRDKLARDYSGEVDQKPPPTLN